MLSEAYPAKDALRLAVIGVGGMAHWQHLPNLRAMGERVHLVALVDVDAARLAATAADYGVPHCYHTVEELLGARLHLDAALVLTPPAQHAAAAIPLLQAGVPVFCEKPLAYAEADAERLVQVAEQTGVLFMVGFNRRFAATLQAAKETLAETRPELLLAEKCKPTPPTSHYPLLDNAIHALDTLRWLAGSRVAELQVTAALAGSPPREETLAALLRFENGVTGILAQNAHGAKWVERYEAYAGSATLLVEYPVRLRRFTRDDRPLGGTSALLAAPPAERELGEIDGEPLLQLQGALCPVDEAAALGFRAELELFFACVRSGARPLVDGAEALETQRLAYRIYRQAGLAVP